jgi:hypothetical protein
MAFKTVVSLDADVTVSLGGTNKKTNKKNPTQIEGYFLGSKKVADKKKKDGISFIHIFQTDKGNVGVWGKTNMDRQLINVNPGTMTRVTFQKMRATPNGDMYVYEVAIDEDNVIEPPTATDSADASSDDSDDGASYGGDDPAAEDDGQEDSDEQEASEPIAPPVNAKASADRQKRVQDLLNKRK